MSEIDVFEPYGPTTFISLRIALVKIEIYADISVFIYFYLAIYESESKRTAGLSLVDQLRLCISVFSECNSFCISLL